MTAILPSLLPWQARIVEAMIKGENHILICGWSPRYGKALMTAHLKERLEAQGYTDAAKSLDSTPPTQLS